MYSIREVCEKTGLTAHTLRYYEKERLLAAVDRNESGFRQYSDADLEALDLICCLKNTGMNLSDIARFMELTREGDQTLSKRRDLLIKHRETVSSKMAEIKCHLDKVTCKIDHFSKMLVEYEQRKEN